MNVSFDVDFDSGEVYIVLDNSITMQVYKYDEEIKYKHFDRINDEELQRVLKNTAKNLLALDSD